MAQEIRAFGLLSGYDILGRAAEKLGTTLRQRWHSTGALTANIGEPYLLEGDLLARLRESGFELNHRTDGITTLSDTDRYKPALGSARNNYWNFHRNKERHDPLQLSLGLELSLSTETGGVRCVPRAWGPFLSAGDREPNQHACAVLARWDREHSRSLNDLVATTCQDGSVLIGFDDIGLAGILSIGRLFMDLIGDRQNIDRFAHSHLSTFDPVPHAQAPNYTQFYVPGNQQAAVTEQWRHQLETFIDSIRL